MSILKQHTIEKVSFQFFGNLCDFLPKRSQGHMLYTLSQPTTIKDAIESLGVPHVEIGSIKIHHKLVPFTHSVQPLDQVEVYPYQNPNSNNGLLRPPLKKPLRFILDVHLGSLARLLRLSGFDSCYETDAADARIASIAAAEERIVLTRDIGLLKHKIINWGYWLRSQHRDEQFKEVANRFDLWSSFTPFSFCLACNGCIKAVTKESIVNKLPSNAALYFHSFFQCQSCKRIYWKGSHYDRMLETLKRLHNKDSTG